LTWQCDGHNHRLPAPFFLVETPKGMAAMIDPKYAPFADSPEDAEFLAQINAMITA
jgi:hypothetical protein